MGVSCARAEVAPTQRSATAAGRKRHAKLAGRMPFIFGESQSYMRRGARYDPGRANEDSELEAHADSELERPGISHRGNLPECRQRTDRIGAGAEVVVHRHHVRMVREVERFNQALNSRP